MQRIGVVGGGIGGLAAAWLLDRLYQVTLLERNLHEQDEPRTPARGGLAVGPLQEPCNDAAERAEPVALVKVRAEQLGEGKDVLPVPNWRENLIVHPFPIGQYPLLVAARTEVACLATEGEQVIVTAAVTVDPGEARMEIAAIDEPFEKLTFYRAPNSVACVQFPEVPAHALVKRTRPGIPGPIHGCRPRCLPATHRLALAIETNSTSLSL